MCSSCPERPAIKEQISCDLYVDCYLCSANLLLEDAVHLPNRVIYTRQRCAFALRVSGTVPGTVANNSGTGPTTVGPIHSQCLICDVGTRYQYGHSCLVVPSTVHLVSCRSHMIQATGQGLSPDHQHTTSAQTIIMIIGPTRYCRSYLVLGLLLPVVVLQPIFQPIFEYKYSTR